MATTLVILRTQIRMLWRENRSSGVMLVGQAVMLLASGAGVAWAIPVLTAQLMVWQRQGDAALQQGLWLLCAWLWLAVAGLAAMASMRSGLGSDGALLLHMQPLPPAVRLRALVGQIALEWFWNWLLVAGAVLGWSLFAVLGLAAVPMLVLAFAGAGVALWLGVVGPLALLVLWGGRTRHDRRPETGDRDAAMVGSWQALICILAGLVLPGVVLVIAPGATSVAAVGLLGLLGLALGPLAHPAGRLYERAVMAGQRRNRGGSVRVLPGMGWFATWLARWRTPTAALLLRGVLNQTRHPLFWLRLVATCVYLALFPLLAGLLAPIQLPPVLLAVGFSAGLVLLTIFDSASSPFGGEGSRLALLLLAPLRPAQLLRAKLVVFLLPFAMQGYGALLVLAWWLGLPPLEVAWAGLLLAPLLASMAMLVVWGSTVDANLNLHIEGGVQALLYEEAPATAPRLALAGLAALLLAAHLWLIWQLPLPGGLGLLFAPTVLAGLTVWRLGQWALERVCR